jgi:hypothetical protein
MPVPVVDDLHGHLRRGGDHDVDVTAGQRVSDGVVDQGVEHPAQRAGSPRTVTGDPPGAGPVTCTPCSAACGSGCVDR